VIEVHNYIPSYQGLEHLIHQPHKNARCIG